MASKAINERVRTLISALAEEGIYELNTKQQEWVTEEIGWLNMRRVVEGLQAASMSRAGTKSAGGRLDERQLEWVADSLGEDAVERICREHGDDGVALLKRWRARRSTRNSGDYSQARSGKSDTTERTASGEVVKYKEPMRKLGPASADSEAPGTGYQSRPGSYTSPSRDPKFLIADDAERMRAKADALNMPSWAHDALVMNVGLSMLEKVYDAALDTPTGKAQKVVRERSIWEIKSEDPAIKRQVQRQQLLDSGIPEAVLSALENKMGESIGGVYEALLRFSHDMKMWGKSVAATKMVAGKAAQPVKYEPRVGWGKLIAAPPKLKPEYEFRPGWGKVRVRKPIP